jgi:Transposase DDE domain
MPIGSRIAQEAMTMSLPCLPRRVSQYLGVLEPCFRHWHQLVFSWLLVLPMVHRCPLKLISRLIARLLRLDCQGTACSPGSRRFRRENTRVLKAQGGAEMTGEDVRHVLEAILPQEAIDRFCRECGVIERQRKLHLGMLVRAMVISAGTPGGAYQADILRSYLACEVPQVARSACYRWFDEPLERFMAALADVALAYARAQQVDLPGLLGVVQDWSIVDSTTVTVRDALREEFPGAGAYAAIKVHQVRSVGCGAPVHDHFSPARDHDSRHLPIDESWRGCGLLADLAYASLARLRACNTHGVRFVMRLKDNWKPKVDSIARGRVTQEFFPGTDLAVLLEEEILQLDGRAIDADVRVGSTKDALHLRLIGIHTPKGYCVFLTNLPPRIGPRQVADVDRVRWEAELSIQWDKSVHRLDQIDAERPCSVKTLLHASLIASMPL